MYINIFPRSGLMQPNLLWRRDIAVTSKRNPDMYPRARRLSEDSVLGDPAGVSLEDGSVDESVEGDHLPLTIIFPPTIPTTTIGNGAETVMPPIGTGVPVPILGTSGEPLTTSTSSPAPGPASTTTSPTPVASSSSSLQTPTPSGREIPADSGNSKMAGAGLSGGAVAGIVVAALSIILVLGVLVYRKRAIKRRGRIRRTWLPRPFVVETTTTVETDAPNAPEKGAKKIGEAAGSSSGTNVEGATTSSSTTTTTLPPVGARTIPRVKPPPVSLLSLPGLLGSAGPVGAAERANVATGRRLSSIPDLADEEGPDSFDPLLLSQPYSAPPGGRPHPRALTSIGVVRCIFEPSMPDELKIRVGEAMRIVAEYDDGWGLCENLRGERGVVPLQCLDRGMGEEGGTTESGRPLSGQRMTIGL